MKVVKNNGKKYVDATTGVRRKTLAVGEKGLLSEFVLASGADLSPHSHPHEQIGYLVSGSIILNIDGDDYTIQTGDSWAIPGNAQHSAKAVEDSVAIEVFIPARADYID